mmetsp:Transcript_22285/g.30756  ORF Transcript_22285/g.30756 Transcript_22285/m.30756 type:complete len:209 (+) Transcript_22285:245-871(+)
MRKILMEREENCCSLLALALTYTTSTMKLVFVIVVEEVVIVVMMMIVAACILVHQIFTLSCCPLLSSICLLLVWWLLTIIASLWSPHPQPLGQPPVARSSARDRHRRDNHRGPAPRARRLCSPHAAPVLLPSLLASGELLGDVVRRRLAQLLQGVQLHGRLLLGLVQRQQRARPPLVRPPHEDHLVLWLGSSFFINIQNVILCVQRFC